MVNVADGKYIFTAEEEKKAAAPKRTTAVPRTKGYTPFEGLGGLFAQDND